MPSQPQRSLIAFLANDTGKSYTVNSQGGIELLSLPTRIRHLPKGWIDFTLKYSRNTTYRGLFRSFVDEVTFVKDSLRILRHLQYTGRGTQEKVYFLLYALDLTTGIYEIFDTPQHVDLSQWTNDDTGVATKLIQPGIAAALKQHENDVYEIPFGNDQVYNDGILLDDTFDYSIYNQGSVGQPETTFAQLIGAAYITNEGDNVGIIHGNEPPMVVPDNANSDSVTTSYAQIKSVTTQSLVQTVTPITVNDIKLTLTGTAKGAQVLTFFIITKNSSIQIGQKQVGPYAFQYPFNNIPGFNSRPQYAQDYPFAFTYDGSLQLDSLDDIFIVATSGTTSLYKQSFKLTETTLKIKLRSRNPPYIHAAMRPLDVAQKLLDLMTNKAGYKFRSGLITNNSDDYWTSGDALRGLNGAKLKISWKIFWDFYRAQYDAVCGIDETNITFPYLYIEPPEYSYDNTTEIINIGEVANFKDIVNADRLYSKIIVGSKDQSYDERAGRLETNSENTFTTPVETGQNELNLVTDARTDAYGITFQGAKYFDKPTTDSSSDNDVYVINVVDNLQYMGAEIVIGNDSTMTFISILPDTMLKGARFSLMNTLNGNDGIYVVASVTGQVVTVNKPTQAEAAGNASIQMFPMKLSRPAYNPILGVVPSVFNLKYLPNPLRTQGTWAGALQQLQGEYVSFISSKKNAAVTVGMFTANANIPISSTTSYWRVFDFTFDTRIPRDIVNQLRSTPGGYITFTVNGYPVQGFVEDIDIKPAFFPSQNWKLTCSSLFDIAQLEYIRNATFINISGGMYSLRNPLKMIPAGLSYPAQYHFKQMETDWHQNRIAGYVDQRKYFQKWQSDDNTTIQIVTDQSSVSLAILDCKGKIVATITPTQKTDPFIRYPFMLFEATINFGVCPVNNIYTLRMIVGAGDGAKTFLSEPFQVAPDWANTTLIEYWNSENMPDFVWSTGAHCKFRVEGGFTDSNPMYKGSIYEDESLDSVNLGGKTYRRYNFIIGGDGMGVPDWVIDLVSRIQECDNTLYDGVAMTLDEGNNNN